MRQLVGTKTRYRRAHAAPLAGLISDCAVYDRHLFHPTRKIQASREAVSTEVDASLFLVSASRCMVPMKRTENPTSP